ncbi:MAG: universal stress protein [Nitrospiria bacterium]
MSIQTVLIPTDFSDLSNEAVDFAFSLCQAMKPSMIFMFVDDWPDHSDATAPLHNEYGDYKREEAHMLLDKLVQRAKEHGMNGSQECVEGIPYVEIIRMVRKRKVDLIVMGTHGETGLPHIMIGSQADRVVRLSPCPVVTVKSKTHKYRPI